MKKTFTVTIGIPTYMGKDLLIPLVSSLTRQKTKGRIHIKEIIVYSDASPDDTCKRLGSIKNKKLQIIEAPVRHGFAYGVRYIINNTNTDAVVILNDDIIVNDSQFIEKLVRPFLTDSSIGVISGKLAPVSGRSFVEQTALLNFNVLKRAHNANPNANSAHTCNGKIMALSKSFIRALTFPDNLADTGNVDGYIYFSCKKAGFDYLYNTQAMAYFKFASTLSDFLKWTVRDATMNPQMVKMFGNSVVDEYKIYKKYYRCFTAKEIVLQTAHVLFLIFLHFYVEWKKGKQTAAFNPLWTVIASTKKGKSDLSFQ